MVPQGSAEAVCDPFRSGYLLRPYQLPQILAHQVADLGRDELALPVALRLTPSGVGRLGLSRTTHILSTRITGGAHIVIEPGRRLRRDLPFHPASVHPVTVEETVEPVRLLPAACAHRLQRPARRVRVNVPDLSDGVEGEIRLSDAEPQTVLPQMGDKAHHAGGGARIPPGKPGDPAHAAFPAMRCATSVVICA